MNIKQILYDYLLENKRIKVKLAIIVRHLHVISQPIAQISKAINGARDIIELFRMVVLIHHCILENLLPQQDTIDLLGELVSTANLIGTHTAFEQMVLSKGLKPYVLYLQKKLQTHMQKNASPEQLLYRNLNLLRRSISFCDILYTFGRYFMQHYSFIIDFNIILAKDINRLYQEVKHSIIRCKYMYDNSLKLDMEEIHEKMYVVFYNCYYYREVKSYIPKWLDTEPTHPATKSEKKLAKNKVDLNASLILSGSSVQRSVDLMNIRASTGKKGTLLKTSNRKVNLSSVSTSDFLSADKSLSSYNREKISEKADYSFAEGRNLIKITNDDEEDLCQSVLLEPRCRDYCFNEMVEEIDENQQKVEETQWRPVEQLSQLDQDRLELIVSMQRIVALCE